MDETEFLESLKTDEEKFSEFTAGAEHFIRLKKQSGFEVDNDPEKTAGALGNAGRGVLNFAGGVVNRGAQPAIDIADLAQGTRPGRASAAGRLAVSGGALGGAYALGKHRGGDKQEKKASHLPPLRRTRAALQGALDQMSSTAGNAKKQVKQLLNSSNPPTWRARNAGHLLGRAAPVAAVGVGAHALGKRSGKQEMEDEIFGEKRAGLAEKLRSLGPLSAGLMGAGAAVGGVGTYLASRPQEDLGGKSKAEDELEGQVKAHQERPENGLLHKMKNRTTELQHGYAQAFRDHPGKASILGAGAGAAGGYGLARLLDAFRGAKR